MSTPYSPEYEAAENVPGSRATHCKINECVGTIEQATDPHYRDAQSAQWNVTVERELDPNTALRVSYVGMNSYRLNVTVNLNQVVPSAEPYVASPFVDPRAPFRNQGTIYSTENLGFQNYQSMEVQFSHFHQRAEPHQFRSSGNQRPGTPEFL